MGWQQFDSDDDDESKLKRIYSFSWKPQVNSYAVIALQVHLLYLCVIWKLDETDRNQLAAASEPKIIICIDAIFSCSPRGAIL